MLRVPAIIAAHAVMWTKGARRGRDLVLGEQERARVYRPRHAGADPALMMDSIEASADA